MRTHSLIGRLLTVGALVVGVLATGATPAAAAPDQGRPFHVSIQADATIPGAAGCAELSGTGNATHMGQITVTGEACGETGVATWTAANGDSVTFYFHTEIIGVNEDGALIALMPADAVVGTGRFVDVAVDGPGLYSLIYPYADGSIHLVSWLDSTIYYDASNRSSG